MVLKDCSPLSNYEIASTMPAATTRRRRGNATKNDANTADDSTVNSTAVTTATTHTDGATANTAAWTARLGAAFNRQEFKNTILQSIARAFIMYLTMRYFMNQNKSDSANSTNTGAKAPPAKVVSNPDRINVWGMGTRYEMRVFDSINPTMVLHDAMALVPRYMENNMAYTLEAGNYRKRNVTLEVPIEVSQHNSSWFAHVFLSKEGAWSGGVENLDGVEVLYYSHDLIGWQNAIDEKEGKSLLSEKSATVEKAREANMKSNEILQHWKPTMDVTLVTCHSSVQMSTLPPPVAARFKKADEAVGYPAYYPPLFVNEFWMLSDQLLQMNSTVSEVKVEMGFTPISMAKFAVQSQFDTTLDMQVKLGASTSREKDKMKRMFLETNPVLLGTTMCVSVAHSVLEALAFRNDISHWKSIKSMEGISVRSMIVKIFMELVIFLYLLDNETSWMILIGNAVGIAIEVWKLCKAVEFKNFGKKKLLGFIPWFEMVDRDSYSKETKEYDEQAMRYLSYVAYPLVAMYSVYALVYEKHKSWYSWVLGSLVGAVYAFGFMMMFPQIFINYKLKSVAHLPMKAMMYKTLNTVIDDLFSFVIKMPLMHRIACFRDDIVFAIYLYQRWIYPVDKTRVNEFGQKFDENGNQITSSEKPNEETSSESSSRMTTEVAEAKSSASESVPKPAEQKKSD